MHLEHEALHSYCASFLIQQTSLAFANAQCVSGYSKSDCLR